MRIRLLTLATVGAIVAVAIACGSDDPPVDAAAVYRGGVVSTCTALADEIAALDDGSFDEGARIAGAIAAREAALASLEGLAPPSAAVDSHDRLVAATREGIALSRVLEAEDVWTGDGLLLVDAVRDDFINLAAANQLAGAATDEIGVACPAMGGR